MIHKEFMMLYKECYATQYQFLVRIASWEMAMKQRVHTL